MSLRSIPKHHAITMVKECCSAKAQEEPRSPPTFRSFAGTFVGSAQRRQWPSSDGVGEQTRGKRETHVEIAVRTHWQEWV